jgi:hypothetical protein
MRGQDAVVNGSYDTWLASGAPDFAGASYAGALATPLRDIVVIDAWGLPQSVEVSKAGTLVGTRKRINMIDGSNVNVAVADDPANDRVNMVVDAAGAAWPPYTKPPASPNAYNFEARLAASADLAANGFTFRRATATAGIMVRVGEIYAYRNVGTFTPLGPLEYRSSLINGRLYLQLPVAAADIYYTLTKPVTIPNTTVRHGAQLWARAQGAFSYASSGFYAYCAAGFFYDATGNADVVSGRYALAAYYTATHAIRSADGLGGGTTNDMGLAYASIEDMKSIKVVATTPNPTATAEFWSSYNGGTLYFGGPPGTYTLASFGHAGLLLRPSSGGAAPNLVQVSTPWDFAIDFLRLYQGDLSGVWIGGL